MVVSKVDAVGEMTVGAGAEEERWAENVGWADPLFEAFFLGGFECSNHLLEDGRRLDLTAATQHDVLAEPDFARARAAGLTACRDGISWVRTEPSPGRHDFRSALPILRAAEQHRVQLIWDLMHFGWPPDVDVFGAGFPGRLARHARAFATWLASESRRYTRPGTTM